MGSNTAEHRMPTLGSIQIVHIGGDRQGEINHFLPGILNFGRHPNCDVVFSRDALSVSRIHARIECDDYRCRLIGLGSNGTYVNGKLIENVELQSGDVVTFSEHGPKLSFVFQADIPSFATADSADKTERIDLFDQDQTDIIQQIKDITPLPAKPAQLNADYPYELFSQAPASSAAQQSPSFIVHFAGELRSIDKSRITLGRGKESDVVIDHPRLLDQHALFYFSASKCYVANSSALKLIWLNGNLLTSDTRLHVNDILMLNYAGPCLIYKGKGKFQEYHASSAQDDQAMQEAMQHTLKIKTTSWLRKLFEAMMHAINARRE